MADDDFKSADAKYTLHLINKLTRDFWVGKLEAQETLEQIVEKTVSYTHLTLPTN